MTPCLDECARQIARRSKLFIAISLTLSSTLTFAAEAEEEEAEEENTSGGFFSFLKRKKKNDED